MFIRFITGDLMEMDTNNTFGHVVRMLKRVAIVKMTLNIQRMANRHDHFNDKLYEVYCVEK